jgi:hypothetical protein
MSLEILAAIIGVTGAILAGLIPIFIQLRRQTKKERKSREVTVHRINDPSHPDIAIALRLFERRIPDEERDSPDDIIRWLREVQDETRRGVCKLLDFFLIARIADNVAGFAYVQFYPVYSLGFFSYLVVDDKIPEARECHVSTKLLQEIVKHLFKDKIECKGVVVEVDEPEVLQGKKKMVAAARIRHFQTLSRQLGFPLKTVSIKYTQPRLSVDGSLQEFPMRLMYAIKSPSIEPRRITKAEANYLLKFFSEAIYGDHFEHRVDLDQEYRHYLQSWYHKHASRIPDVVDLS